MCRILSRILYTLIVINAAIWQAAGFGARPFGRGSSSSSVSVTSSEQSLLAFIYSCMGATSNAALGCPCAGNGKRCKDPLSICQNFKCICDSSISNTVNGQCVAVASVTNSDTTTTTTTSTTSTTSVTTTTTTAAPVTPVPTACPAFITTTAAANGCKNKCDTALSTSASTKCTASTTTDIAYLPLTTPTPTGDAILEILNVHNAYRRSVQAIGMNKLDWSDCAASNAQHLANTCPSDHDRTSNRQIPGFGYCGQNIAWNTGTPMTWSAAIKLWYDEVNAFTLCADNTGKEVGHYTQVMWADTTLIGCGMKSGCPALRDNGLSLDAPVNVYVCNYCTGGNIQGANNAEWCPYQKATVTQTASNQCGASCKVAGSTCATGDCLCAKA